MIVNVIKDYRNRWVWHIENNGPKSCPIRMNLRLPSTSNPQRCDVTNVATGGGAAPPVLPPFWNFPFSQSFHIIFTWHSSECWSRGEPCFSFSNSRLNLLLNQVLRLREWRHGSAIRPARSSSCLFVMWWHFPLLCILKVSVLTASVFSQISLGSFH